MSIFISKELGYDNNELVVILALNYLQTDKHEILYVDIKQIGYVITNRFISSKKDRILYNNIKLGMTKLVDRGLIKLAGQSNNAYAILWKESKIKIDKNKDKFTLIELWEIQLIFQENTNQPFNLLHFFVDIVGTINNKTKEWHMSQDSMVESFGGSKSTINDYLKQLEKLKLLYVHRPNMRRVDGTFHNINNSYGRFKDKELVISSARDYISQIECEDIDLTIDRRSIKLRYNAFVGGSKKYNNNFKLIEQLYDDCIKYNKSLNYKPIEDKDNNFAPKDGLDLSVFAKYGYFAETDTVVTNPVATGSLTQQSGCAKDDTISDIEPNQDYSFDVQVDDNEKSIADLNEYEFIKHMKWDEADDNSDDEELPWETEDKSDDCLWGINSPFGGNKEEFDIQGDVLFG